LSCLFPYKPRTPQVRIIPVREDEPEPGVNQRQRGRCRAYFAIESEDLYEGALRDWWLCPPCRSALLPPGPVPS
jgi:hypothetical protein